jgi:protein-glutamine gamma-glutamyltransferase
MKNSTATLCSLALCLWGYQTGAWSLAILMVLALEARHFIKRRWTLSVANFQLVYVLAGCAWLLSIFYLPLHSPSPIPYNPGYHILKSLPVGLFPLVLAQAYCANFASLYRPLFRRFYRANQTINVNYPYFGVCLFAASATGGNTVLFLIVTAILVAGFLGSLRSQRFSPNLFLGLMGLALAIGLMGVSQYHWLQANFKPDASELFSSLLQNIASSASKENDPQRKAPVNADSLQKADRPPKNDPASPSIPRPADRTGAKDSSKTANQPGGDAGTLNAGASSQGVPPSAEGTGSSQGAPPSAEGAGSAQGTPPSIAGAEVSQNIIQAIKGSESSNNSSQPTGSTGNIDPSVQTANQTGGDAGNTNSSPPSQGAPPPSKDSKNPNEAVLPQGASQSGGETSKNNAPPSLQHIAQKPSGTETSPSGNPPSAPGIVQQVGGRVDPQKSLTQIGKASALRPSDAILFRVAPSADSKSKLPAPAFPLYIREAAYNQYSGGTWNAVQSNFVPQGSSSDRQHWILGSRTPNTTSVRISANLPQRKGILKLPVGTSEIDNLAVDSMQVNQYGTVAVQGKPGEMTYTVQFDPTQSLDRPPTPLDLDIPQAERSTLQKILQSLDLKGKSGEETIEAIAAFFQKDFRYSLELPPSQKNTTPLSTFLLDDRFGHCEYFASATSLLLRAAGIPTRYVVGYSVHEYSPAEQQYIVRARNAHAWAIAYANGAWVAIDTTPGGGISPDKSVDSVPEGRPSQIGKVSTSKDPKGGVVKKAATGSDPKGGAVKKVATSTDPKGGSVKDVKSFPQKVAEAWTSLRAKLSRNRETVFWASAIIGLGLGIILFSLSFVWRAMRLKNRPRRGKGLRRGVSELSDRPVTDGLDSEFYLIEKRLGELGLERKASETVRQWIVRLKQKLPESKMDNLNQIIDLHYRYRFDPRGIEQEDRAKLRSMIDSWLVE